MSFRGFGCCECFLLVLRTFGGCEGVLEGSGVVELFGYRVIGFLGFRVLMNVGCFFEVLIDFQLFFIVLVCFGLFWRALALSIYCYRIIGISGYRVIGLSGERVIGLAGYRVIELSGYRVIGLPGFWKVLVSFGWF